jgi:DNA-binding transcriptional regulator YiaG
MGEEIKRIREKLNMTQQELAYKLHVQVREISRWETGVSEPRLVYVEELKKLAKRVGIEL